MKDFLDGLLIGSVMTISYGLILIVRELTALNEKLYDIIVLMGK